MSSATMPEQAGRSHLMQARLVASPPCLCLYLRGELDLSSAGEIPRDELSSRPDLTTVLVDLSELTFCDVIGIKALLTFSRIHEAQGRSVVVVRATPFMWRLMRLCGVTERLGSVRPVGPPPE